MNNRDITTKSLIFFISMIIIGRISIGYIPDMKENIERYVYKTRVSEFEKAETKDVILALEQKEDEKNLFYIGRSGCGDCRFCLKNIMEMKKIIEKNGKQKIYYLELPEELSDEERDFYEQELKIDSIPVIVSANRENIKQFGYDKIVSKSHTNKLKKFLR